MKDKADKIEENSSNLEGPAESQSGAGNLKRIAVRWWVVLIFGLLGYLGALYYMSVVPNNFEAVAVLEVDIKTQQLMGAELESERLSPEIAIATEASKLMGPAILAAVAESPEVQALREVIPPDFSFTPRYWREDEELTAKPASAVPTHEMVDRMVEDWVEISGRRNTALIEIRVNHPDAESARVIADTILRIYLEKEQGEKKGGASEAYKILKEEADQAQYTLETAQASLQVYVSAMKLNEEIQTNRAELIAMRQRYKSKHPKMIQVEAVYRDLYERFRREIVRAMATESEQNYWLEHKATMVSLDKKISSSPQPSAISPQPSRVAQDEWLALVQNALSSRGNLLNSGITHQQKLYESITRRMTEIDVADEHDVTNMRVVEPAFIGQVRESIRLIYMSSGAVLGLILGCGVALLLGLRDYRVYDVTSLEQATGLNCLAAIPDSGLFDYRGNWESVLIKEPNSASAEAIRNLRASIKLLGKKSRHRTLLVTSAIPGEGKTTMAAELASSFAVNQDKTLIIDFDLRRPRLVNHFPCTKGKKGIVDLLAGQSELDDVIIETDKENLFVIGSGNKASNPSELLDADELRAFFKIVKKRFDRVVVDAAPILPVSDSRLLAKHVQSVICVSRVRKAPVGAILRAFDLVRESGGKIAGVVLNGLKKNNATANFGYYGEDEYGSSSYYGDERL